MARDLGQYDKRMKRVGAFIAQALEAGHSPSLEEIADAAALSLFHFHRIYRLVTGETVAQTLQRLKLAHGLERVAGGERVTDAALASGFGSSQNFARALRQRTGNSVRELRASGLLRDAACSLSSNCGDAHMKIEFVDHSPVRIICRTVRGPYEKLNLAYRGLFGDICDATGPGPDIDVFGIPIDDPREVAPEDHRFTCALALGAASPTIANVEHRTIGGGHHARSRHRGPYLELPAAIDSLYLGLFETLHRFKDCPTFIHYVDQPANDDGPSSAHISDIYVPLVTSRSARKEEGDGYSHSGPPNSSF